jgi:hypothetical protein
MRAKTESPTDLISAIRDNFEYPEDDCFGREFAYGAEECGMCNMRSVCMVLTAKKLEDFADSKFAELTPWLDMVDWEAVPQVELISLIKEEPQSIQELREVFAEFSKCKDEHTVANRVNKFIRDFKLIVNNGVVHYNN